MTIENDDDIFDDLHDMIHENESINDDDEIPRRIVVVVDSEDDSTDNDSTDDDSTDDDTDFHEENARNRIAFGLLRIRNGVRQRRRGAR